MSSSNVTIMVAEIRCGATDLWATVKVPYVAREIMGGYSRRPARTTAIDLYHRSPDMLTCLDLHRTAQQLPDVMLRHARSLGLPHVISQPLFDAWSVRPR